MQGEAATLPAGSSLTFISNQPPMIWELEDLAPTQSLESSSCTTSHAHMASNDADRTSCVLAGVGGVGCMAAWGDAINHGHNVSGKVSPSYSGFEVCKLGEGCHAAG